MPSFCPSCGSPKDDYQDRCPRCTQLFATGTVRPSSIQPPPVLTAPPQMPGAYYQYQEYADIWLRFAATFIDSFAVSFVTTPIMFIAMGPMIFRVFSMTKDSASSPAPDAAMMSQFFVLYMVAVLVSLLVSWLYHALMESSKYQGTLGKYVLGIKITDLQGNRIGFGRATGRHFSKIYISSIFLIGYILAFFNDRRQALHDTIAGTLVLKK